MMHRTVEEILKQYPYIGEDIQKAQKEINRYIELQQEARNPLKGQVLTDMPRGSGTSDQTYKAVERIIAKYQEEIDKYVAIVNELLEQKRWMDKAYISLNEDERRFLYLMYDQRYSVRRIGDMAKCGRYTAQKIIDEAKEKIKRIAC